MSTVLGLRTMTQAFSISPKFPHTQRKILGILLYLELKGFLAHHPYLHISTLTWKLSQTDRQIGQMHRGRVGSAFTLI